LATTPSRGVRGRAGRVEAPWPIAQFFDLQVAFSEVQLAMRRRASA